MIHGQMQGDLLGGLFAVQKIAVHVDLADAFLGHVTQKPAGGSHQHGVLINADGQIPAAAFHKALIVQLFAPSHQLLAGGGFLCVCSFLGHFQNPFFVAHNIVFILFRVLI